MTVKIKIGPREKVNQESDQTLKPSFVKAILNGPYADPSSRNYGYIGDQFLLTWIKRAQLRQYFLRPGTDNFLVKVPPGQYIVSIGLLRDLKESVNRELRPTEMELSLWLLEWIDKFKGQPDLIIELT